MLIARLLLVRINRSLQRESVQIIVLNRQLIVLFWATFPVTRESQGLVCRAIALVVFSMPLGPVEIFPLDCLILIKSSSCITSFALILLIGIILFSLICDSFGRQFGLNRMLLTLILCKRVVTNLIHDVTRAEIR